jgi:hypothetical protein
MADGGSMVEAIIKVEKKMLEIQSESSMDGGRMKPKNNV